MTPPIWIDWEYRPGDEDYTGFLIGYWKGQTDSGRVVSIPCLLSEDDLKESPAEIQYLKDLCKANGLESYFDLCQDIRYGLYPEPTHELGE